jgi:hypothetical protein
MSDSRPKSRVRCAYCGHRLKRPGMAAKGRGGRRYCNEGYCGGKPRGRKA